MDKEKRASDWPIQPGVIVNHTSDGSGNSPDVGVEVGLTGLESLYIGEVSSATLGEYGIDVPLSGWWVCIRTATELRPIALTCNWSDGIEAEELVSSVSKAIRVSRRAAGQEDRSHGDRNVAPVAPKTEAAFRAMAEALVGHSSNTILPTDSPASVISDLCRLLAAASWIEASGLNDAMRELVRRAGALREVGL